MPGMRQQPQGPSRISRGNPLGITDLWIGSSSLTLVKGYNANKSGANAASVIEGAGQAGHYVRGDGSTVGAGFSLAENSNVILGSTDSTWFIVRRCRDTTVRSIFMHYGYENGASSRCLLGAPEGSNITWDYGNATTGSGRLQAPYTKDTLIETLVVVAGQIKGREIWRRGVKLASNPNAKASRTQDSRPFSIGRPEGGPAMDDVETYMFGVANREWSDAEIVAWSKNPWGVIEAPRLRLAFPVFEEPAVTAAAAWTEAPEGTAVAVAALLSVAASWTEAPESTATAVTARVNAAASWTEAPEGTAITASALVSASASWTEAPETTSVQATVGNDVTAAASWVEAPEGTAIAATARVSAAAAWTESREGTAAQVTVGNEVSLSASWTEAREGNNAAATARVTAAANWTEAPEGFTLRVTNGDESADIDASLIPKSRVAVFPACVRIAAFPATRRIAVFKSTNRIVRFQ